MASGSESLPLGELNRQASLLVRMSWRRRGRRERVVEVVLNLAASSLEGFLPGRMTFPSGAESPTGRSQVGDQPGRGYRFRLGYYEGW